MALDTLELFARMLKCEAEGEGDEGMRAIATLIMNRAEIPYGEFSRVSNGGNVRNILTQDKQFTCFYDYINGQYNPQNIYNMRPDDIEYDIANWALNGGRLGSIGNSIFYFNPYSDTCPTYFPSNVGVLYTRIGDHCFYQPTSAYADT